MVRLIFLWGSGSFVIPHLGCGLAQKTLRFRVIIQSKAQLQLFIQKSVPLSVHMGVQVRTLNHSGLRFALPLKPNHNHLGTAFGGTLIAAQALACWAWLTWRLKQEDLDFHIVIKNCTHAFARAVDKNFIAACQGLNPAQVKRVVRLLKSKGRADLRLKAQILVGSVECGRFKGTYVIMTSQKTSGAKK